MYVIVSPANTVVGSCADPSQITWHEGYALVADRTIPGDQTSLKVVQMSVTDAPLGATFVAADQPLQIAPEIIPPAPPALPYSVAKTTIITRLTDAELEAFDQALTAAPVRQRRMWADCNSVESDSPYFGALHDQLAAAFGAPRAAAILAAG